MYIFILLCSMRTYSKERKIILWKYNFVPHNLFIGHNQILTIVTQVHQTSLGIRDHSLFVLLVCVFVSLRVFVRLCVFVYECSMCGGVLVVVGACLETNINRSIHTYSHTHCLLT